MAAQDRYAKKSSPSVLAIIGKDIVDIAAIS
jgi:hypothetical protein